jgi:hypothetical protein
MRRFGTQIKRNLCRKQQGAAEARSHGSLRGQELPLQQACQRAVHTRVQRARACPRSSYCIRAASWRYRHRLGPSWRRDQLLALQGAIGLFGVRRAREFDPCSCLRCSWEGRSTRASLKALQPLCIALFLRSPNNAVSCARLRAQARRASDSCRQTCSSWTLLQAE